MTFFPADLFSTYSIVAYDPQSGQIGGAVQTHQMGVGRIIPYAVPGVGVVASQSLVNISYNPMAIQMLKEGIAPERIIDGLTSSDPNAARRQVAVINQRGEVAAYSGAGCIREFGHATGEHYSVQANMMTHASVIPAMKAAFEMATGDLAARMVAALQAAQAEDGDIRGMQSAALKVVSGSRDTRAWETIYDLRVDEHDRPVEELARLAQIRSAHLLDGEGHRLLADGDHDAALERWAQAREAAPQQEELAFWQAVTLADTAPFPQAVQQAGVILRQALAGEKRREQWIDLIGRLDECGLIARQGAAAALLKALQEKNV